MKRMLTLALAAVLALVLIGAHAEAAPTPYEGLTRLLNGKSLTLTMRAEDVEGIEEALAPYGTVTCTLAPEDGGIVFTALNAGETLLRVKVDAAGYAVEANLTEPVAFAASWEEAAPAVDYTEDEDGKELSVRLTGPDHALVTITCFLTGTSVEDYVLDYGLMLLNADGTIQNFFDTVSASGGASARESLICLGDYDLTVEGEGEETVKQSDGFTTLLRRDAYTVCLDDDEIGSLTLISDLVISE